jgi:DNA polymerase III alpha subunit
MSWGIARLRAIWSLSALHNAPETKRTVSPGQEAAQLEIAPQLPPDLLDFTPFQKEQQEWKALGFSPEGHPMRQLREKLDERGILPCGTLQSFQHGEQVTLAPVSPARSLWRDRRISLAGG